MASRPFGVMARFVGGPKTELVSGRLLMIRGDSRLEMSTMETVSLPGAVSTTFPASSHVAFSSLPMIISCALAAKGKTISSIRIAMVNRTLLCFMSVSFPFLIKTRLGSDKNTKNGVQCQNKMITSC